MARANYEMQWWTFDERTAWLSPVDAWLGSMMTKILKVQRSLEVGVWRGGWATAQLKASSHMLCTGIDPYPGLDRVRLEMLDAMSVLDVNERFDLHNSWDSHCRAVCDEGHRTYGLIHIDGEHSQEAAAVDLRMALRHSGHQCILVIDDVFNASFPGVAAATWPFLQDSDFAVLVQTDAKIYACRADVHDRLRESLLLTLTDASIPIDARYQAGSYGENYYQSTDLFHRPIIQLLSSPALTESVLRFFPPVPLRRRVWNGSAAFLPPSARNSIASVMTRWSRRRTRRH